SRIPLHQGTLAGNNYVIGQAAGSEQVTLTGNQIPSHSHTLTSTGAAGTANIPSTATILADEGPAGITAVAAYQPYDGTNQVQISPQSVGGTGGNQPHDNLQPYLALNFIISLSGIFPSQS